jgi:hypothetical protein
VVVSLPTDFFLPPPEEATTTTTPPAQVVVTREATEECTALGTEPIARGKQQSADGNRILINKDVAGQRYAITKYPGGRVTGNIFFEDGGPPRFLDCQVGTGNELSCRLADPCPPPPLPCSFVNAQGNEETVAASLPGGFLDVCPEILDVISNARTGVGGCLRIGAAPIPQPGAPSTIGVVRGNTVAMAGQTAQVGVDYDATAQLGTSAGIAAAEGLSLLVAVAPGNDPDDTATGYFEFALAEPSGSVEIAFDVVTTFRGDFQLLFATSVGGAPSRYRSFRQFVPPILTPPIGEGGQTHGGARGPGAPDVAVEPPRL